MSHYPSFLPPEPQEQPAQPQEWQQVVQQAQQVSSNSGVSRDPTQPFVSSQDAILPPVSVTEYAPPPRSKKWFGWLLALGVVALVLVMTVPWGRIGGAITHVAHYAQEQRQKDDENSQLQKECWRAAHGSVKTESYPVQGLTEKVPMRICEGSHGEVYTAFEEVLDVTQANTLPAALQQFPALCAQYNGVTFVKHLDNHTAVFCHVQDATSWLGAAGV